MTVIKSLLALAVTTALLSGCSTEKSSLEGDAKQASESSSGNSSKQTLGETKTESDAVNNSQKSLTASAKANQLFDSIFQADVDRNPVTQTYLGIKKDYDKWHDLSEENIKKEHAFHQENLAKLQAIDVNTLDPQTAISYRLYKQHFENKIADHQWRFHNYPVNQMFGTHSQIPAFLINQHAISNKKEAQDYIARVNGAKTLIEQLIVQLKLREEKVIIPPTFVFAHVIRDSKNILVGAPFDNTKDSTLLADFTKKVTALELSELEKAYLESWLHLLPDCLHLKPQTKLWSH